MAVTDNVVDGAGNTGILVRRDAEGEDGSLVSGNRVQNVRADSGGSGQNGNGINLDKANGVIVSQNRVDELRLLRHPLLLVGRHLRHRQRLHASWRDGALRGVRVRGRGGRQQPDRRRGQRHRLRQFQGLRRAARHLLRQCGAPHQRRPALRRRQPADRRRHRRGSRRGDHRQRGGGRRNGASASAGAPTAATSTPPAT